MMDHQVLIEMTDAHDCRFVAAWLNKVADATAGEQFIVSRAHPFSALAAPRQRLAEAR